MSRWNFRALRERLRFKYAPRLADWLIRGSTMQARKRLKKSGPIGVLIDNTILAHGITHQTAWISTGTQRWGEHNVKAGYSARIPVHSPNDKTEAYQNVRYLPGIASLAREGFITLNASAELIDERFRQPVGRFSGYGYFDYDVFGDINISSIDGHVFPVMGPKYWNLPSAAEQQRERLAEYGDPVYRALRQLLGSKNSQDAWHIWTAEKYDLFCFLTMDFRLRRTLESQRGAASLKSLRTRVMTPREFGQYFKLLPVQTNILSYHDASFPVRPDLCWSDGGGRRKARKKEGGGPRS